MMLYIPPQYLEHFWVKVKLFKIEAQLSIPVTRVKTFGNFLPIHRIAVILKCFCLKC